MSRGLDFNIQTCGIFPFHSRERGVGVMLGGSACWFLFGDFFTLIKSKSRPSTGSTAVTVASTAGECYTWEHCTGPESCPPVTALWADGADATARRHTQETQARAENCTGCPRRTRETLRRVSPQVTAT
uniref:Uncharacterized protein n=1 Tax=Columba livia TaxID=8932 RepID=R7VPV5_COLLI